MKKYVIGVDTGASKTLCGLFDEQMRLVRVIQRPTDAEATADELLDALDAHVRELARGAGVPLEDVRGVGTAFPSHVDFAAGVLLETPTSISSTIPPCATCWRSAWGCPYSWTTTPTPRRWPSTGWARGAASET